ncbi:OCIA domain-containing protein 1-like [Cheilinus undulatus]|uniref:OCIA domain-containing protein 1-like n=1 Tax=Cheilinus undulatus TaxID=241271 RepID=UPI001BD6387A|nr:OCIA domain-containing protein 1-like [Cheilinus undulatus]
MSSTTTGFPEDRQGRGPPSPAGIDYIPTDEERMVFKECNQESFWYRSVPFSVVSMAVTQALVARGTLTASPRFGALPKVVFAGFCGYLAGKMSYMKTCQEKFKRLENSPLGEALRKRTGLPQQFPKVAQSELSDPDTQSFDSMFQPAETLVQRSYNPDSVTQSGQADNVSTPVQSYVEEEEEPRRKSILYEDLRLKNRENYEVTLTQKAETLLKPTPEREPNRAKKSETKNIYGDVWEE